MTDTVHPIAVAGNGIAARSRARSIVGRAQQSPVYFFVPGPLEQRTGGYLFARHVVEGLRAGGREVEVIELPGRFPAADAIAHKGCAASLAGLPDGAIAVVDGLALAGFERCLAEQAKRLRIVGFVHHPLALETGLSPAEAACYARLESRLWPLLRGVICPSAATAQAVAAAGVAAQRIAAAPPGTARPESTVHRKAGAAVRLLAVGAVTPRKGHALLIEALAPLRDAAWRLVCAGSLDRDPRTAADVRAAIAARGLTGRARLAGELAPAELAREYGRADVFVLPSFHEGYGMAFAEALVHGLPIVATTAGAIPDTVPAKASLLVAPGDVDALRAALARIIQDETLRARLATGAAEAGSALPSWAQAIDHWAAVLDRLVA
jgi:glycosyltransferase involved in cell wall biosynthesis